MGSIYEYTKTNPKYNPNRFEIVGGMGYDENFQNYINELNQYIGGGSDFDVETDEDNVIITIGGSLEDEKIYDNIFRNGTANTIDPGLKALFSKESDDAEQNNKNSDIDGQFASVLSKQNDTDVDFYESILISGSSEVGDYSNAIEINKFIDVFDSTVTVPNFSKDDLNIFQYFN